MTDQPAADAPTVIKLDWPEDSYALYMGRWRIVPWGDRLVYLPASLVESIEAPMTDQPANEPLRAALQRIHDYASPHADLQLHGGDAMVMKEIAYDALVATQARPEPSPLPAIDPKDLCACGFGEPHLSELARAVLPQPAPQPPAPADLGETLYRVGFPIVGGAWHGNNKRQFAELLLAALRDGAK